MYDDVLYPTDGSEASMATLPHVVSQAHAFDARVHVLYVVNTTYARVGAGGGTNVNSLRERGEVVLDELAERLRGEDIDVVTRTREGDPHRKITAYAADETDMIVMGTRGRGGIEKYLLGSVTEKVVRTADVPVFTVRTPESDELASDDG
ncbi:nucleotide-binding universal stress UspA family protein [Halorubrum alkaliphilum]|uniref:Nucleotide-binding universal stress UspA family protein n=1 Tax=Halorubrum alkaliphilum TaxID=261290 RepID=A0A8T4GF62_9EURY|nr:universal stress protein [Halorubrum alkaliphilum]MBP1922763.1 nucleotide-binding universal stress UspA family protein [Halorubrum alkaliphilum]